MFTFINPISHDSKQKQKTTKLDFLQIIDIQTYPFAHKTDILLLTSLSSKIEHLKN